LRVQWERDQARRKAELSRLRQKIADEERENELKSIEERYKTATEMERMKSDLKKKQDAYEAEEHKKKILREAAEEEEERKEAQAKAVADWERKKEQQEKDRKAADKAAVEEWEREQRQVKEEEERIKRKIRDDERAEKERKDAAHKAWLQEQKEKEEAEKKRKKEEQEEIDRKLRDRMHKFGFQENQIDAMLDEKKAAALPVGASPYSPQPPPPPPVLGHHHHAVQPWKAAVPPIYIKVHRDHLSLDTLHYYQIPWEYDSTNSDYIILLREMDTRETDILFEHTKRLRKGGTQLLIEERGRDRRGDANFAFVRRRSKHRSVSRRRSPVRIQLGMSYF